MQFVQDLSIPLSRQAYQKTLISTKNLSEDILCEDWVKQKKLQTLFFFLLQTKHLLLLQQLGLLMVGTRHADCDVKIETFISSD